MAYLTFRRIGQCLQNQCQLFACAADACRCPAPFSSCWRRRRRVPLKMQHSVASPPTSPPTRLVQHCDNSMLRAAIAYIPSWLAWRGLGVLPILCIGRRDVAHPSRCSARSPNHPEDRTCAVPRACALLCFNDALSAFCISKLVREAQTSQRNVAGNCA